MCIFYSISISFSTGDSPYDVGFVYTIWDISEHIIFSNPTTRL